MNTTIKTLAMAALAAFTFGFAPSTQADTVAKIIETGVTYDTVQEAINDAEDGQTVQMLADAKANVTITGKAIKLDLAGKVLNSAANKKSVITISSGAGLTLVDSAPTATHTDEYELLPPGGVITGAKYQIPFGLQGGGVNNSGTFTMLGGTIIGNDVGASGLPRPGYGGGVYNNGTMTVGGTASIRGNLNAGAADNLYLPDGKTVSVGTGDAAPKAGMAIGISVATAIGSGESLAVTGANAADYHTHFSSDNPAYYVINGENNAVTLSNAPAARNANTGVDYATVQAAVDAASDADAIQLLRDANGNVTVTGKAITLDLNGKELSAYSGNVITLGDDNNAGTLTLIDGTAVAPETVGAGRITAAQGGSGARGVKVTKGTFNLTSGRISGCYVIGEDVGGGVYSEGTVIMTGGAIENCRANSGGGVRSWNAFTMSGGVIRGCSASVGGGIVANDTFNLGGTAVITNNSASLEGGGVYYTPSLTLSGSVTITDNTNSTSGSADNLFARKRLLEQSGCYTFAVADGFDGRIGVTTEVKPTKEAPVTFATNVVDAAVAKRFFSDDAQYAVSHKSGNELQLIVPEPEPPVATVKIGEGEAVEYTTIEAAWEAACAGTTTTPATLTLLKDVTVTTKLIGPSNDDFSAIFDLNDKVITFIEGNEVRIVHQHGKLSVVDNAANKTIKYFEPDADGRWARTDAVTERAVQGGYFTGYAWMLMLEGGDVEVSDVSFVGAKRNPVYTQSVNDLTYGKCTFSRVNFLGNVGEDGSGGNPGAIDLSCKEFQYVFEDCVFRENVSPRGGGAIGRVASGEFPEAVLKSPPRLVRCVFENNRSLESDGGAVRLDANLRGTQMCAVPYVHPMIFEDCAFGGNEAGGNGGAIAAYCNAHIMLMNCVVTNNVAGGNGGGICKDGDDLQQGSSPNDKCVLINTTITGNRASAQGGGVYFAKAKCLAAGTRVLMADGTEKAIEDIVEGDIIRTFDHESGKMSSARVYLAFKGEAKELPFTLTFDNGATLSIVGRHDLLEKDSRKYVTISAANAHQYVGAEFYGADGAWHALTGVTTGTQTVDYYSLYTAQHQNVYANGMLTAADDVDHLLNIYELDENLKADATQLAADIAQYGLATFEEASTKYGMSRSWYDDAGAKYNYVAIGKGLATLEGLEALFASSVSNADPFVDYGVGVLTLGANVVITNNTTGDGQSNVYLNYPKGETSDLSRIALAADHTGLCVGVTTVQTPGEGADVPFTTPCATAGDVDCFTSDEGYSVVYKEGTLFLSVNPPVVPVEYVAPVYNTAGDPKSGIDHWVTNSVSEYTEVTSTMTTWGEAGQESWYVVKGADVQIDGGVTCAGHVNLILVNGASLTIANVADNKAGIATDEDGSFAVYGQPDGAGALAATGGDHGAGIGGGEGGLGSNITINGGTVVVTGAKGGAGLGGGYDAAGNHITINGGTVVATGGFGAAGIGSGMSAHGAGAEGSYITINGGTVTATGIWGAGIGGGRWCNGSDIAISNATVFVCGARAVYEGETLCPDCVGNGVMVVDPASNIAIDISAKVFFNLTGCVDDTGSWIEPILPMPESFEGYTIMTPETAVTRVLVSGMSALPGGQPLPFALTNAATEVTGTITVNDEKGVQFANKLLKLPYADSTLTLTAEDPPPVATVKIGTGEAVEYTTIEEAWTAACEGMAGNAAMLTLLKDVTTTSTLQATRGSSGDPTVMTLDLNGCVLKAQQPANPADMFNVIDNAGTLTVKDSKFGDTTIPHYFVQTKLFGQLDIWTLTDTPNENVVYGGLITGGALIDPGEEGDVNGGAINNYNAGGSLTIASGNIAGNFVIGNEADGGAIASGVDGATFLMTGGEVCYNSSSVSGGGIIVYEDSGTAAIQGGKIHHNLSASCAGVAASGTATLTISGGEIYGNSAIANGVQGSGSGGGAGVTRNTATLIIEGGKIYDNTANGVGGGGILNNLGTVTITGGEIYGNIAQSESGETSGLGGGVANTGTLTISGGAIYGNSASTGGGGVASVTMSKSPATVTMTGGAITNNQGVAVLNMGAMTLGGTAVIAGDPEYGAPGLYLPIGPSGENYLVTISSETPFTTGAAIGVTTAADPGEGVDVPITTNGSAGDVDYFTSDRGHFVIFKDGALYLSVNPPTPSVEVAYRYPVYNTPGDPASGIAKWEAGTTNVILVQSSEGAVTWGQWGEASWYAVTNAGVVLCDGAACQGDVNLILCKGAWLEITNGVSVVESASFTVYGQPDGAGELWALGGGGAAITGSHITLNGGTIAVSGTGALIGGDGASGVSADNWVSPEAKVVFDLVGAEVVWAFDHAAIVTPDELTVDRVLMTGVDSWTGPAAFQLMKDDWLAHSKPLVVWDEDGTPFADAVLKLNVADGALKLSVEELPDEPVVKDESGQDVTIVVPDEWRVENGVLDEDAVDTQNPMENGMPAWQDYVLGLDPNNIYSGIYADSPQNTSADKVTIETKNLDVQKLVKGYGVKYRLDTKLRGKGEYTKGVNQDAATFEVSIAGEDPTGVYKLNAVIFSNDVEIAQSAEAVNIVGMLKQTQAVTNAIISVPWSRLAPGLQEDIGVTNVVKTATLDEGDELRVYRPGSSTYEGWTLDANKQWVPSTTVALDADGKVAISEADDPTDATIPRGSGIWLCRKAANAGKPYYLYGQAEGEASAELTQGPNLIGATGLGDYDFNAHILNAQEGDTIMVPVQGGAPKRFEFKDGSWGYMKGTVVEETVAGRTIKAIQNTWTTNESFAPAGTGFWLHNNSGKITIK